VSCYRELSAREGLERKGSIAPLPRLPLVASAFSIQGFPSSAGRAKVYRPFRRIASLPCVAIVRPWKVWLELWRVGSGTGFFSTCSVLAPEVRILHHCILKNRLREKALVSQNTLAALSRKYNFGGGAGKTERGGRSLVMPPILGENAEYFTVYGCLFVAAQFVSALRYLLFWTGKYSLDLSS